MEDRSRSPAARGQSSQPHRQSIQWHSDNTNPGTNQQDDDDDSSAEEPLALPNPYMFAFRSGLAIAMLLQSIGWQPDSERTMIEIGFWSQPGEGPLYHHNHDVADTLRLIDTAIPSHLMMGMLLARIMGQALRDQFPDVPQGGDTARLRMAFIEGINFQAARQEPQMLMNVELPLPLRCMTSRDGRDPLRRNPSLWRTPVLTSTNIDHNPDTAARGRGTRGMDASIVILGRANTEGRHLTPTESRAIMDGAGLPS